MANFQKVQSGLDMGPLQAQLAANADLWDQFDARRTAPGGPHSEMTDIWVRYNDPAPFLDRGSFEGFNGPHIPVWLPAADVLPALKPIVFGLMAQVEGEFLGGILLTRLPAGGFIQPHRDAGWHAGYFDKFYLAINAPRGARFCWEDGAIDPDAGDVWHFRNDVTHWVENRSSQERLAAIVCIRTDKFKGQHAHQEEEEPRNLSQG
jgi:hypothetical protein